jgi:hypothetical protein
MVWQVKAWKGCGDSRQSEEEDVHSEYLVFRFVEICRFVTVG